MVPSSRGLGHHPLKVETRVRTPLGLPVKDQLRGFICGSLPTASRWKTQQISVRVKPMWWIHPGQRPHSPQNLQSEKPNNLIGRIEIS